MRTLSSNKFLSLHSETPPLNREKRIFFANQKTAFFKSSFFGRGPRFDFGFGGRVRDVLHVRAGPVHGILVGLPPLPLPRVGRGRLVGAVVHPAVPLGRDVGSIVIKAVLVGEDDPTVAEKHVIIVLIVFVAVNVLAHQLAVLDLVRAKQSQQGAFNSAIVFNNLAKIADGLAHSRELRHLP